MRIQFWRGFSFRELSIRGFRGFSGSLRIQDSKDSVKARGFREDSERIQDSGIQCVFMEL